LASHAQKNSCQISKSNDKLPSRRVSTDSAAATAVLFSPEKVAATIAKVQWSSRDEPNLPGAGVPKP
jgi:hypothetical protein